MHKTTSSYFYENQKNDLSKLLVILTNNVITIHILCLIDKIHIIQIHTAGIHIYDAFLSFHIDHRYDMTTPLYIIQYNIQI